MAYRLIPDPYGRPPTVSFDSPRDFVDYVRDLDAGKYRDIGINAADEGSRRQADEINRNPDGWVMSGGHPRKKDDYLARNIRWIAPSAVAAFAAGPVIGALRGAGSAAGGVLPSSHLPTSALMHGPGAMTSQGVSAGVNAAGAVSGVGPPTAFGTNWHELESAARGTPPPGSDFLGNKPPIQAATNAAQSVKGRILEEAIRQLVNLPAYVAARGSNQPSPEEKAQLEQLRQLQALQQRRIELQNPLYEAVTRLAMNRLPADVQAPIGSIR